MEAQFVSDYQTRLLSAMDLERNQLNLAFSNPYTVSVSYYSGFNTVNLIVDAREIPFPGKINLHSQIGELIYSELKKTSLVVNRAKNFLEKVVRQLKLEKDNSRASVPQNEELKNMIIKIGFNP